MRARRDQFLATAECVKSHCVLKHFQHVCRREHSVRSVWRAAVFGHPWRFRVVSDDGAGRGLDQGQVRSWQNKRAKLNEIEPVRSCYDSYDLAHTEVMHFTVGNAFLVTPLMEYWFFRDRIFLAKGNV